MKTAITAITAQEILDSRGNPTLTATVWCGNVSGSAAVPSGASTGRYEAHELRDNDPKRYNGKGCLTAVANVEEKIAPALLGEDVTNQARLDRLMCELDGTENKTNLGANAILAVSLAAARAAANVTGLSLARYLGGVAGGRFPVPMMNILNGGAHADNNLDIQEFMIAPVGASSYEEGLVWCVEIYHKLKSILKSRGLSTAIGDEGGFAPNLRKDEDGLKLLVEAITAAGREPGKEVAITLDAAASEWAQEDGTYFLPKSKKQLSPAQLLRYWRFLTTHYPIVSIEDAAGEDDWETWQKLTERLGGEIMLVGDDLFVTNPDRLTRGIEQKAANAVLIKVNQIGTLSETLEVIYRAKEAGFDVIISHRSGETEDTFISDLAVAVNAGFIKTGAPCRAERTAKYNRLLELSKAAK
ncbi:MAG TPA: phosphopyruvate hydratase [Clostridiales bacterium]|nr:phosphopyruvate hydratase [Clostridiales bacterium]